jgi:hypothetical protein
MVPPWAGLAQLQRFICVSISKEERLILILLACGETPEKHPNPENVRLAIDFPIIQHWL